jgi:hypothetical protein
MINIRAYLRTVNFNVPASQFATDIADILDVFEDMSVQSGGVHFTPFDISLKFNYQLSCTTGKSKFDFCAPYSTIFESYTTATCGNAVLRFRWIQSRNYSAG